MKGFFTSLVPAFDRVLLVESGSRHLIEALIPTLRKAVGDQVQFDLVTCFAGTPEGFDGEVFRISDYQGAEGRARLIKDLGQRGHAIIGIICAAEPIMTKWKWMLAARVPAKLFILNENNDFFWVQWSNWRTMRHFVLYRAGLSGAGAVRTIVRLILFPFTVIYLILYAAAVHFRRKVHS
ncbi:MAG: hypothetical protein ABJF23_31040 [Bryobacteraceae bacterium]